MDIRILIAIHKPYWTPSDPVYLPLHVGAAGKAPLGFTTDDTGNNISTKTPTSASSPGCTGPGRTCSASISDCAIIGGISGGRSIQTMWRRKKKPSSAVRTMNGC